MTILHYKLDTTNDLLTSRAGLLTIAQLMDSLNLAERIDPHFPCLIATVAIDPPSS